MPDSTNGSVADLYATLGMDLAPLGAALQESQVMIKGTATEMSVSLKEMQTVIDQMAEENGIAFGRVASAADVVSVAVAELAAKGATAAEAITSVNVALNDQIRKEAVMAEIQSAVLADAERGRQGEIASAQARIALRKEEFTAMQVGYDQEAAYRARMNASIADSDGQRIALQTQLREEELAAIRLTNAGLEQEMAIRAKMAEADAASELSRLGLISQLQAAEIESNIARADEEATAVAIMSAREKEYTALWLKLLAERDAADAASNGGRIGLRVTPGGISPRGYLSPTGGVIAAAAAAFGAYEIGSITVKAGEAAQATQNLADRLTITWQQARELEQIAQLTNVQITGLAQSAVHLAEALEEGDGKGRKTAAVLDSIGVSGSSAGELLLNFLKHLSQISDETERMDLLHQVFQRQSQALVPLVKNLDGLQGVVTSLGPNLDDNLVKRLLDSNQAVEKLSISWAKFKENLAVGLPGQTASWFMDSINAWLATFNKPSQTNWLGLPTAGSRFGMSPAELLQSDSMPKITVGKSFPKSPLSKETDKDIEARNRIAMITLESERRTALDLIDMEEARVKTLAKIQEISGQEELDKLLALELRKEDIKKDFAQRSLDLEETKDTPARAAKMVAIATEAESHRALISQKFADDEAVREFQKHERMLEQVREFNRKLDEYESQQAKKKSTELDREEHAGQAAIKKSLDQRLQDAKDFNQFMEIIGADMVAKDLQRVQKHQEAVQSLSIHVQKLIFQDEDAMNRGLKTSSVAVLEAMRQTEAEIRAVASGLADLIVDGGKFGDTMTKATKQIIKTIIIDLVQVGFGALLRTIFNTGSALNELGRKLESVFGIGQKRPLPYGGGFGIGDAGGPTGMGTPTWMEQNTGAIEKSTEQIGKDTAAAIKDTTATISNTSVEGESTRRTGANTSATEENTQRGQQPNTTATEKNTAAIEQLTTGLGQNTAAESANTVATNANTLAIISLTAAVWADVFADGGGKAGGIAQQFLGGGGGGFGGNNGGYDPFGGYDWSWLYNLPVGGGGGGDEGGDGSGDPFSGIYSGQPARNAAIDMRGSHFYAEATEAQTTRMLTKVTDKLRLNRIRV